MLRRYSSANISPSLQLKPLGSQRELRGKLSHLALKQFVILPTIREHTAQTGMNLSRARLPRNLQRIGGIDPAARKNKDAIAGGCAADGRERGSFRFGQCARVW